jgi:hypothetical protein
MGEKDNSSPGGKPLEQSSRDPGSMPAGNPAGNQIQSVAVRAHRFTAEERFFRISIVAYQKAAQRGFEPGSELDDWLAAEKEVDAVEGVNSAD